MASGARVSRTPETRQKASSGQGRAPRHQPQRWGTCPFGFSSLLSNDNDVGKPRNPDAARTPEVPGAAASRARGSSAGRCPRPAGGWLPLMPTDRKRVLKPNRPDRLRLGSSPRRRLRSRDGGCGAALSGALTVTPASARGRPGSGSGPWGQGGGFLARIQTGQEGRVWGEPDPAAET